MSSEQYLNFCHLFVKYYAWNWIILVTKACKISNYKIVLKK